MDPAAFRIRVLHLEDNPDDRILLGLRLERAGVPCEFVPVATRAEFEAALEGGDCDLVLCDFNVPGIDGPTALRLCRERRPEWPVIIISGQLGEDAAAQCLQLGAIDYVLKDRLERFAPAVRRALDEAANRRRQASAEAESRASEERFRATFEQAAVGMAHIAPDGRLVRVNARLCQILGYARDDLMALGLEPLAVSSDAGAERRALQSLLAGETSAHVGERRCRRRDGTVIWTSRTLNVVRDAAGRPDYLVAVIEDITPRKEAEFRLKRVNRLHAVLSRVSEVITRASDRRQLLDLTCRIAVEQGGLAMAFVAELDGTSGLVRGTSAFGRTGDHLSRLTIRTDGPLSQGTIGTVLRTGAPDVCNDFQRDPRMEPWRESAMRHGFHAVAAFPLRRDGAVIGALALFADEAGYFERDEVELMTAVAGGLSFAIDALDRSRRQDEAEAQVKQQASLLDHARDAILVRSLDGRLSYWNQGAERLYGWSAAEALGRTDAELLHPDRTELGAALQQLVARGEWTGELNQRSRDGRPLTVDARWTLVRDSAGRPASVLCLHADITERKRFEELARRSQRMESIGTLAGGIAHELNNLLSPILMGAGLLRQIGAGEENRTVIDNIERNARRGAELLRQVLAFARGVEGERVFLRPAHLMRELEHIVVRIFPRNIVFEPRVPEQLWPVVGDPTQLHQVLLNLCVNARDAMPHGGRLGVTAANRRIDEQYATLARNVAPGRYVCFEVSDTGRGIPRDELDRIFDPFFTTKEQGQGTGLGLSTVMGIVRGHGGFVDVTSTVGKGTTFRVHLPARPDETPESPAEARPEALPRGAGELVLVVDDEPTVLNVTRRTLEAFGYRVITAADGAEAIGLHAIRRQEIDVVLTDMVMPVMDGPALIGALRRNDPAIRIIAASGLNGSDQASRASSAGVKDFLAKPYSAEALLDTLGHVLTR